MKKSEDIKTQQIKIAQKKYEELIGDSTDPAVIVLKGHLYSENQLELLIIINIKRGDKIIEKGSLTYHHKLLLVESFDNIPDTLISSLRSLNKLRNKFAHDLNHRVSENEILKIGSPQGAIFTKMKSNHSDTTALLKALINHCCGFLTYHCISLEEKEIEKKHNKPTKEGLAKVGLPI